MTVALITGTSTGIGHATALYLARKGHHVYASMRNPDRDGASLRTIASEENLALDTVKLDVNDVVACQQVIDMILEENGCIDVLINNAGIASGGALEEVPESEVRKMFDTNFFSALRLMQLVIPSMREAESGTIINVTSIMGRLARPGGSAYCASKFALEAASESLAQEVRRFNIRIALIEPGVVKTPLHTKGSGDDNSQRRTHYAEFDERNTRLFGALLAKPALPIEVAKIVHHAIATDNPKLRYLVGDDAHKWAKGRAMMSDEEWVNLGRAMPLEEYVAFYKERFDMEI